MALIASGQDNTAVTEAHHANVGQVILGTLVATSAHQTCPCNHSAESATGREVIPMFKVVSLIAAVQLGTCGIVAKRHA